METLYDLTVCTDGTLRLDVTCNLSVRTEETAVILGS